MMMIRIDSWRDARFALLLLGALAVFSAEARAADPNEKDLEGSYIGTAEGKPLWVSIKEARKTADGCSFRYITIAADSVQKGKGTTTEANTNIHMGHLDGVVQRDKAQSSRTIILKQKMNASPVWRVQKIDNRGTSITNDPAGVVTAASRLADHTIRALLGMHDKLLILLQRPTQSNGALGDATAKLLDDYIAAKPPALRATPPPPPLQASPAAPDSDPSLAIALEATNRELAEAREQLKRETERRGAAEEERQRLETAARTAYFTVMPYDDMVRAGLISRAGVFGATPRLRDFRLDSFTKIDTEESKELVLSYRIHRLHIVTPHPPASYQLIPISGERTLLRVVDREAFWRGRFLVIGVR